MEIFFYIGVGIKSIDTIILDTLSIDAINRYSFLSNIWHHYSGLWYKLFALPVLSQVEVQDRNNDFLTDFCSTITVSNQWEFFVQHGKKFEV